MASVYKRTWVGQDGKERVRWVSAYKDQHGRRHNRGFKARKDAKAFLVLVEGEVIRGIHTPEHASITVAEAAALWLKRAELEQLERSTIAAYTGHVRFHIAPLIGSVKLAKLSTPVVQLFRDKLLETGSRALAKKVLASLKSIVAEAMRRGLVAQNTASPVTIDSKKRAEGTLTVGVDVPTKSEIGALIEAAQGRWRPLLVTLVFTGMRASELRGLSWDAVDLEQKVIHIRQRANLWGEIGPPKSAAGRRAIPMAPLVVNALREWRLACPKGGLGLVFPTSTGSVQTHGNIVARGWEPLQRQCFGCVKYPLHSLRHFFASFCIDQNFNVKRLQTMLGHSSSQMTLDVYSHWMPNAEDDQARLAAAEAAIFAPARPIGSAA